VLDVELDDWGTDDVGWCKTFDLSVGGVGAWVSRPRSAACRQISTLHRTPPPLHPSIRNTHDNYDTLIALVYYNR